MLLAVSGLAILGLVFLAAIWAGTESDAAALDRQRQLVDARLQDQVHRVAQEIQLIAAGYASLLPVTSVQVRVASADVQPTESSLSVQAFDTIVSSVFGYNAAFLVTPEGELAFDADADGVRRFKWVRPLLRPLIDDLRHRQVMSSQPGQSVDPTIVQLMRLEGRPSIAGVIALPEAKIEVASAEQSQRLPYLLVFRFLDGATLDALSREQGLAGARYARTADPEENEVAYQVQATATGDPIGYIIWEPDLPGSRVLGRLVPVLSVAGLIIAALFFALMMRLRQSLTDLSASEHHARHLSVHDVLTGLPNRAYFAGRLEEAIAEVRIDQRKAVIALIDLDKFKDVNDVYGHAAGDELLRLAVSRMKALVGSQGTLARIGGDEFALLIPHIEQDDDWHIALLHVVVRALDKTFHLRGGDIVVRVGCSIGMASVERGMLISSEILRRADVALYEAKATGRGRVVAYDPSLDHWVETRENLKKELRLLLQENAGGNLVEADHQVGHLEVFFQGVHHANGQASLSGAEALVRWRHPARGLLSPDLFIPVAQEAGLIDRLGDWVLRIAAREASGWPDALTLAVNVSPSQIRRTDFDTHVMTILAEEGLPPSRLELELTEAALFDIDEKVLASLGRLRAQGVRIALDDFGTGYSSLSHLIQFNIDRIKIDRAFVRLLGSQAEGAAIVSAVLGLSRTLGKATTAEGVETEAQKDFLVAAGCTELQGFLLSKPMPAHDFAMILGLDGSHDSAPYSGRDMPGLRAI
ncbi:putative bifunctional diguanylate cyclase/phosphodiesterase [Neorhizobium sp. NPDC001467]|uniref:putative bifunctional diguanylate cyclase/phosphodiesterase n=1 Tax=Neorhizobium sp. NPDC001467 TaxID=3390595 RepID=UPI003CFDF98E